MDIITASSATLAWEYWYNQLLSQDRLQDSRDGEVIGEQLNAITVLTNPRDNLVKSTIRNLSVDYAIGELLFYLSGSNRLRDISKYSKAWNHLSDDAETINSAYGHRIIHRFGFNQWEHCKQLLQKDPSTRQAVIHIKDADPRPTKDLPCTLTLQYLLRDNCLHCTCNMRSNDIWLGFPYDVFTFTCLQTLMAMELGVELGAYTHIAGSLHLYRRHINND